MSGLQNNKKCGVCFTDVEFNEYYCDECNTWRLCERCDGMIGGIEKTESGPYRRRCAYAIVCEKMLWCSRMYRNFREDLIL